MMQGAIRSQYGALLGCVSQRRISKSLQRVAPIDFDARRRDVLEKTNPIPYYAPFFGYNIHMDQNEKLQCYGCTHVVMTDGCSRMVSGFGMMEIKNSVVIYDKIFRPIIAKYGVWNQLRIDHGKEFRLTIFAQELLESYRYSRNKTPWKQTTSTDNYVVEKFWPEVNSRVNYPIKKILSKIADDYDYDLSDPIMKRSLSFTCCSLARGPFQHLGQSWNYHRVPGPDGCIPIQKMEMTNKIPPPNLTFLPSTDEVVRMYECMGSQLTRMSAFGEDPLKDIHHAYESTKALTDVNQAGENCFHIFRTL